MPKQQRDHARQARGIDSEDARRFSDEACLNQRTEPDPFRIRKALTSLETLKLGIATREQFRRYIAMSTDEPDAKDLTTLAGKWRTGDPAQRWEVLSALFERIRVRQDRKIEGYTPRMDRGNRVRLLISTAFETS